MRRWSLAILILFGFAYVASAIPNPRDRHPAGNVEVLLWRFGVNDPGLTADACAPQYGGDTVDEACGTANYLVSTRDVVITAVGVTVAGTGGVGWAAGDACDVFLLVRNGAIPTPGTTFEVGGDDDEGAPVDLFDLEHNHMLSVNHLIVAGSTIQIKHGEPADDTNCQGGGPCVCAAQQGSYQFEVFGIVL